MADADWFDFFKLSREAPAPSAPPPDDPVADDAAAPDAPVSPTCLKMGEWGRVRGRVVRGSSDVIRPLRRLNALPSADDAVADLHALCFDMAPALADNPADRGLAEFVRASLDSPDFHGVRALTVNDVATSEIACGSLASEYERLLSPAPGSGGSPLGAAGSREAAVLSAVARAARGAAGEIAAYRDAVEGCGMGSGSPGAKADPRSVAAMFRRVRNSPTLRRIMEQAGRFRAVARSRQRTRLVRGTEQLVGVTTGRDPARFLSSELARLAHPALRLDVIRRLAEGSVLSREYADPVPEGKGPVIVSFDESGSMQGTKNENAKAYGLALAWVARAQRRWCGLVAYTGDGPYRLLALPPGGWDEVAMLDWLDRFFGHGSNIDIPVREMPDIYRQLGAPVGRTDLIMVTDAIVSLNPPVAGAFNAWRRSVDCRVTALVVGSGARHCVGSLADICDGVHVVRTIEPGDETVAATFDL